MMAIKTAVVSLGVASATGIWLPALGELPESLPLLAVSGLAGGITRWLAKRERIWPDGFSTVISGFTSAIFLSPLAHTVVGPSLARIEMDPRTAILFGGYTAGLLGVVLIGMIIDIGEKKREGKGGSDEGDV